jgi:hypothetical protein
MRVWSLNEANRAIHTKNRASASLLRPAEETFTARSTLFRPATKPLRPAGKHAGKNEALPTSCGPQPVSSGPQQQHSQAHAESVNLSTPCGPQPTSYGPQ